MSPEIGELAKALAGAQHELEPALKNANNPLLKNRYADLASCYEACRKVLPAHGLAVSQIIIPASTAGTVHVRTMLMHESGQWLHSDCILPAMGNRGVNDAQAAGSAITYARRYGLSAIVGLVADEDDDGNAANVPVSQKRREEQQTRTKAVQNNPSPMTPEQSKALMAYLTLQHGNNCDAYLEELSAFFGRKITSSRELTKADVSSFIDAVNIMQVNNQGGANDCVA